MWRSAANVEVQGVHNELGPSHLRSLYTSRDAHWPTPGPSTPEKKTVAPTAASPVSPTKVPPSTSQLKLGKPINGKQVATAMKDGTNLSPQFQRGGCKAKPCPQGAHRCAAVLRKDRVCGAFNHGALTNPRRGGGCLFWVKRVRAARGETSYDRPHGGPNAPLAKAFISCGWGCLTVDWLLDPSQDLADERRQQSLSRQLEEVIFIAAAIDCSTKSKAREIPRRFEDGRPAPGPLRSEVYPDGLPTLSGGDAKRVDTDNRACNYVLHDPEAPRPWGRECAGEPGPITSLVDLHRSCNA